QAPRGLSAGIGFGRWNATTADYLEGDALRELEEEEIRGSDQDDVRHQEARAGPYHRENPDPQCYRDDDPGETTDDRCATNHDCPALMTPAALVQLGSREAAVTVGAFELFVAQR